MLAQIDIDECTSEISDVVAEFLTAQGGNTNGYCTYVSGKIDLAAKTQYELSWNTPSAKEELTDKGKAKRAAALQHTIEAILVKWGVTAIEVRAKDVGYGVMDTHVIHVIESKRRVTL